VTNTTAARKESASGSIEQFGYRQELKRTLSLFDLTAYGLVYIIPIAPFAIFGIVFNASAGMVPLVYVVGLIAMLFTAMSYVHMSRLYPIAGSVYAYAGRTIGQSAGFLAGWAMLLDYLLNPALNYVAMAVAIHAVIPSIAQSVWIVTFVTLNTVISLLGIETTARTNLLILIIELVVLAVFLVAGAAALVQGTAGAHLSITPLFNAAAISPSVIFGALSLGFDAISTLAEETKGGTTAVGKSDSHFALSRRRSVRNPDLSCCALCPGPDQLSARRSDLCRLL
jgi:amino acid transporter